eukprot:642261-Rhodomonas_salina.2
MIERVQKEGGSCEWGAGRWAGDGVKGAEVCRRERDAARWSERAEDRANDSTRQSRCAGERASERARHRGVVST